MKGTSKTKMGLSRFLGGSSLNGDVEILQWFIITFPNLQVLGAHMIIIDHIYIYIIIITTIIIINTYII